MSDSDKQLLDTVGLGIDALSLLRPAGDETVEEASSALAALAERLQGQDERISVYTRVIGMESQARGVAEAEVAELREELSDYVKGYMARGEVMAADLERAETAEKRLADATERIEELEQAISDHGRWCPRG